MLRSALVRIVGFCITRPWRVIAVAFMLAAASAAYAASHFAIKTDVTDLFSPDLPWARRGFAFLKTFNQQNVLVVISAPTPELAEAATGRLAQALAPQKGVIRGALPLDTGDFFARAALLFPPLSEVARMTRGLAAARRVLGILAADPSLRGGLAALDAGLAAVRAGQLRLDDLAVAMNMAADTAGQVLAGRPASFSWRALAVGTAQAASGSRHFIEVDPVLDYRALEPGRATTDAIANTVRRLDLAGAYQAQVQQTGMVPIDDDQFATIRKHVWRNMTVSLGAVFVILLLALRSWRIIVPVALSIAAGLAIAAAFGLVLAGALNLISVAFFVLFVGLGIDFGIQFSVRYRAERHDYGDLRVALLSAARKAGGPLALAATATAIGFASFLPTSYRGLSELGEIAGAGMIIAFAVSITLLPALLAVSRPPPERAPMGFAGLAPIDRFLVRRRVPVLVVTLLLVLGATPLLTRLSFDFNPLHLRRPDSQSVATFLKLRKDPRLGANAVEMVAPDLAAADAIGKRLGRLPQVAEVRSLSSLIPADQPQKLSMIRMAAAAILPVLAGAPAPAPTDRQNIQALDAAAKLLSQAAGTGDGPGEQAARRLARLLARVAQADPAMRRAAEAAVVAPLELSLDDLKQALDPQPVTAATIPPALKRSWVAPDGQARVQVLPKGDPDDTKVLRRFATAVLRVEPQATGPAILLYEAANTVVHAFIVAAIFALSAIALLLWITLRRLADVVLTLVPLLLAGLVTLELCVVFGLALNFANIIALPLLLGVGVAFKIYYIMAWRRGKTALVQSTLTRAVIFSAMTTATAFGSLWLSSDPGTSSMGQLMALSLCCTMAAAVLFQPALMGPPRRGAQPSVGPLAEEEWAHERAPPRPVGHPAGEVVDR
jgi:uncharacterized protein